MPLKPPRVIIQGAGRIEHIWVTGDRVLVYDIRGDDQRVRAFDKANGRLIRELTTGRVPLLRDYQVIALAPDGRSIFSAFEAGRVVQIDVETGAVLRAIALPADSPRDAKLLIVSPDGDIVRFIAFMSLFAWDLKTDALTEIPFHDFSATMMIASDHGRMLWSDGTHIQGVALATGERIDANDGESTSDGLVYLEAKGRLVRGLGDGRIEIWRVSPELALEETVRTGPNVIHNGRLASLRQGGLIAASTADQRISLLSPGDKGPRERISGFGARILALTSDDAEQLWAGDAEGRVWAIDLAGEPLGPPPKKATKLAMTNHYLGVAEQITRLGPEGYVSVGGDQGWVKSLTTRDVCAWTRGHPDAVSYRSFSSRFVGCKVVLVAKDRVVLDDGSKGFIVLDATLATVASLAHKNAEGAAVNPTGDRLITTGGTSLNVWRTDTWEIVDTRSGPAVPQRALAWTTNDRVLFVDKNDTFGFFDSQSLKRASTHKLADLGSMVTNAQGSAVAVVTNTERSTVPCLPSDRVHLWNVATDTIVTLPENTTCPAVGAEDVCVVDKSGSQLLCFAFNGKETRRIDLPGSVRPSNHTYIVRSGTRVAVIREIWRGPPGEIVLVDLAAERILGTHLFDRRVGPLILESESLVFTTYGGRVESLALDKLLRP